MSTRAHIKVTEGDETIYIYHHHDGYPDGVGIDVQDQLEKLGFFENDGMPFINTVVASICEIDDGYKVDEGIHGDEEYLYVVDCDNRTLKCYFIEDMDMSENEIIRKENLVEI